MANLEEKALEFISLNMDIKNEFREWLRKTYGEDWVKVLEEDYYN